MPMAGGRPQPGSSIRRPSTPAADYHPSTPTAARPANAWEGFEFTFDAGITLGTIPPPGTPEMQESSREHVPRHEPEHFLVAEEASSSYLVPATPIRGAGGLYGQAYVVGNDRFYYQPSDRMDEWLEKLRVLSLDREVADSNTEDASSAAAQLGSSPDEHAHCGEKRAAVSPKTQN